MEAGNQKNMCALMIVIKIVYTWLQLLSSHYRISKLRQVKLYWHDGNISEYWCFRGFSPLTALQYSNNALQSDLHLNCMNKKMQEYIRLQHKPGLFQDKTAIKVYGSTIYSKSHERNGSHQSVGVSSVLPVQTWLRLSVLNRFIPLNNVNLQIHK